MPNYRRYRVPGDCYFFTVNLLERHPNDLLVRHIDLLRMAVQRVRRAHRFQIDAWVVLPDHMHCVLTLPTRERRSTVRQARAERGLWQRRFWEQVIRNERDYAAHLDYVPINNSAVSPTPPLPRERERARCEGAP